MDRFAPKIVSLLNPFLPEPVSIESLSIPPDPTHGDFALPCFPYAKAMKLAPPKIAKDIEAKLIAAHGGPVAHGIHFAAVGPYLNFTVAFDEVKNTVFRDILNGPEIGTYGQAPPKSGKKWVLEFSSLNVAKPFQFYHLRGTALGMAFARMGRFRGMDVTTINHLGDWGTQYGMLTIALNLFKDELPENLTVNDLERVYVKIHEIAKQKPELEDEARQNFKKLEAGDPATTAIWKKCVSVSMKEFDRVYQRLGVSFDHVWGESFYKDMALPVIEELKKKKVAELSEGAWVVFLPESQGREIPPCILQKKDGATIYASRDVAAAKYRHDKFNFDRMTYIVGAEQKLHFEQVFGVLKKAGWTWAEKCEHVANGIYRLKGEKMSTRKGNVYSLDHTLNLAKDKVTSILKERLELPADELEVISEKVAVGSILFFELSTDPARDVDFDLDRAVSFDGETGPYVQYAHTRCLSILRKYGEKIPVPTESLLNLITSKEELALLKLLGRMPMQIDRSLSFSKANQLANYIIDVVKCFNQFYREQKVVSENVELTRARILCVEATRRVLARSLGLLGVPLPDRM